MRSVAQHPLQGVKLINLSSHYDMAERYYQLTQEQKIQVGSLFRIRKNQTQIACLLGVHKSTISRELCRNVPKKRSWCQNLQCRYSSD
ncbi:MAG: helix-turn-helix domain-containing protein [Saprospiraceae bacterium]|nr:helix-turn-helix domain-containing protein [Candidatus Vicinibacter affinis]